jgi:phosphoribosylaminoimidazole-succinocarboxamide synthase
MIVENTLAYGYLPELGDLYQGKVRDNHIVGDRRVLVATDRISVFDRLLDVLIPYKGAILNAIAVWFFEQTKDIVKNHLLDWPDPNVIVARQCRAYPIEMVVRGYLTGSAWKDVKKGHFESKYGFLPKVEGKLQKNCPLKKPILTPTTKAKEGHDLPLTKEQAREWVGSIYDEMAEVSLKLYLKGAEIAEKRGLILVDAKYEFGDHNGELILIDEVNTPDSSRYWYKKEYEPGREMIELSKQFVRDIISSDKILTEEQIEETSRRYIELYERLTGRRWEPDELPIKQRLLFNLIKKGYIKGGFVQVIADDECSELKEELEVEGTPYGIAGKSIKLIERLNKSIEPLVVIMVGKGEEVKDVAARLRFPLIVCSSSIFSASNDVPLLFTKDARGAVRAAKRILSMR